MRSIIFFLCVFAAGVAAFGGFDEREMDYFKEKAPKELLEAFDDLTEDDKIILYQRAVNGELLSTLLTENERIVKLASVLVNEVGKKVTRLDGDAKKFVIETIHDVAKLAQKMGAGEKFSLSELAKQEQKRFRALSNEDQTAIREQFPIMTTIGVFTNDKLKAIAKMLAKDTLKARAEL